MNRGGKIRKKIRYRKVPKNSLYGGGGTAHKTSAKTNSSINKGFYYKHEFVALTKLSARLSLRKDCYADL